MAAQAGRPTLQMHHFNAADGGHVLIFQLQYIVAMGQAVQGNRPAVEMDVGYGVAADDGAVGEVVAVLLQEAVGYFQMVLHQCEETRAHWQIVEMIIITAAWILAHAIVPP